MSETHESSIPPAAAPLPKPDPLYQVAAWVAIVAGILFIAVTILSVTCAFLWCG